MLPACGPNFAQVARTTYQGEEACNTSVRDFPVLDAHTVKEVVLTLM
jgi:hypothetical protein